MYLTEDAVLRFQRHCSRPPEAILPDPRKHRTLRTAVHSPPCPEPQVDEEVNGGVKEHVVRPKDVSRAKELPTEVGGVAKHPPSQRKPCQVHGNKQPKRLHRRALDER
mmetsp:Transcript_6616/g.19613  ORF Transcript_6616/g.19613 Transcript_6616/m.19613 type:complete len:108 (+) Transcript_6616:471-794(+)